ncbi:MAG: hypothetical protein NTY19_43050 [Planctomycetota bacterium]|nr:hypothetical protein [Planctomycetota bacterium]
MIASVGYHAVPKLGSFTAWKFKEGRKTSSKKLTERKIKESVDAARQWGKLLAREPFPGLDHKVAHGWWCWQTGRVAGG